MFFHIIIFFSLVTSSFSQDVFITKPRLTFDENQLTIAYDIISENSSDNFYVWVEIINDSGNPVKVKSLNGDIGRDIQAGYNKRITWNPAEDSVFLNEEIFVQVKAEKYVKSFDRRTMLVKSLLLPGWGQSKVSEKPLWISSIAAYGLLAGGIVYQKRYQKSYSSYRYEEDAIRRTGLLKQSQKQLNVSSAMIYTSLSFLLANLVWVAVVPEKYQPLKHAKLTVDKSFCRYEAIPVIKFEFEF